jgi:hypothetical protein
MTFTVYIRIAIESYFILFLSSMVEIHDVEFKSSTRIVSFVFSILVLVASSVATHGFFFLRGNALNPDYKPQNSYYGELFDGLRKTQYGSLYYFMMLFRRVISLVWTIQAVFFHKMTRIIIYAVIQSCFFAYTVCQKPMDNFRDNLIECIDDGIYLAICIALVYLNKEDRWTNSLTIIITMVLSFNWIIITCIQVGFMIKGCIKKCCKRRN